MLELIQTFVSIVVPTRNEEINIGQCLESLIQTNYPKEFLEIIVVDGMSNDATRKIVQTYISTQKYVRLLDNNKKILASGWNTGIKNAKGDIIFLLNAHAIYAPDYISECLAAFERHPEASNIGGVYTTIPQNNTLIGRIIVRVLSHPFGVGNSPFRIGVDQEQWTDAAAFGGYRRNVFKINGFFNEQLVRSQDMEFHKRMKKNGLKILITPRMRSRFFTRTRLMDFLCINFRNGLWTTYPLSLTAMTCSVRHFVPFIAVLIALTTLCIGLYTGNYILFLSLLIIYTILNIVSTIHSFYQSQTYESLFLFIFFPILHISYGLGSLVGFLRGAQKKSFWIHIFQLTRG